MRALLPLLCVTLLLPSCKSRRAAAPQPVDAALALTFEAELQKSVRQLSSKPGAAALASADSKALFSYFTGHRGGGHTFPAVYLDPAKRRLTVTGPSVREVYPVAAIGGALAHYRELLVAKGYEIDGVAKQVHPTLEIDGKTMVVLDPAELFADNTQALAPFTPEQKRFLHSEVGGWQAFAYLAGVAPSPRDHPLIVSLGWAESAHFRVLAKDQALRFDLSALDAAFAAYRSLVARRAARP